MPTDVDSGVTPLPDGGEVHWSREDTTEDAAGEGPLVCPRGRRKWLRSRQIAKENPWEG